MYRSKRCVYMGVMAATLVLLASTAAEASPWLSRSKMKTIVYFVRHAEDQINVIDPEDPLYPNVLLQDCVDVEGDECCVEVLNPLGLKRAEQLGVWFEDVGITEILTHVVASHKVRTRQTVWHIAAAAGLDGEADTYEDQEPGDGVINVPPDPDECDVGWTSSKSALDPQIAYINVLPLGSRAVVCSHSPNLYPIMESFGIDTSDAEIFPRKGDGSGKVAGFNNLWMVQLDLVEREGELVYEGTLIDHIVLDLMLQD